MSLVIRPAKLDELAQWHPESAGVSYRAWAVDDEEGLVGVIGLALTRPRACVFCGFDERLRPYLKCMALMRLLKKLHLLIIARDKPVYALLDPKESAAPAILTRMGFAHEWTRDGNTVYVWRPAP